VAGKQAKTLTDNHIKTALKAVKRNRYPERDRVILLLSIKAGLRAGEIAKLTWPMVCEASGEVGHSIELRDVAAKKSSGRTIPLNPELRRALQRLRKQACGIGSVVCSERGLAMKSGSIVNWFKVLYQQLDLDGCSSHSGRRTFITRAARMVHHTGGSLRDVQQLAGHRSIDMTQRYIDGDTAAQRQLVALL